MSLSPAKFKPYRVADAVVDEIGVKRWPLFQLWGVPSGIECASYELATQVAHQLSAAMPGPFTDPEPMLDMPDVDAAYSVRDAEDGRFEIYGPHGKPVGVECGTRERAEQTADYLTRNLPYTSLSEAA